MKRHYTLCTNLNAAMSIPVKADRDHYPYVVFCFSAYPGHSESKFSIDYPLSSCNSSVLFGCHQRLDSDCCNRPGFCYPYQSKQDQVYTWIRSTDVPSCTDMWTVQSQYLDDSNAELSRNDHNEDNLSMANIIGPYEGLIHNWVIQSQPSFVIHDFSPHFNINLNITSRSDFSSHLISFKVNHFNVKPYESQQLPVLYLHNVSYLMNSMIDLQILKLRLRQYLICSAFHMNHTSDNAMHMFLEVISHKVSTIPEHMEFCHVRVPSMSKNSSVLIDYEIYSYVEQINIQIIIQLIPKEHCLHCLLHVVLWENLNLNKTFRYTTWSNITEAHWFCMNPYAFRLQANITRTTGCSDECYLLLKFNHFNKPVGSNFQHYFDWYYRKEKHQTYTSWIEAHQRCSRIGASLPKLTRDISRIWKNMANMWKIMYA